MNLQTDLISLLPAWHAALVIGPSLMAAMAALFAGRDTRTAVTWQGARWAASAALAIAALSLFAVFAGSTGSGYGLRADTIGGVVMLLVNFVGWVIVRYSQPYLNGERDERRYVRWLMATLAAVGVVVATNHMLVLALAWWATSLALHRLLTFFGDRRPALVAAHKKFIVARLADLCMLAAVGLLFHAFRTLHIDQLAAHAAAAPQLPGAAQAGLLLMACAALLKCAQLPFHGWLIQVMEAPTPISALLHAGVVNLGGFVLMRFSPLIADAPATQTLLVVAGTATAVLAGLVMTTRISIKVMLAWSTCAQMGFMLMQCGLGAWGMALLHLVAHSLYKAHAFLGAGGAVRRSMLVRLTPRAAAPGALALALGALVGLTMTWVAGAVMAAMMPGRVVSPAIWVLTGIVALALVPLVNAQSLRLGGLWLPALCLSAFGVALAHFFLHTVFAAWVLPDAGATSTLLWVGVAVAFSALFLLQSIIIATPRGAVARRLYPWFYGGLYLDEKFNHIAFALWPPAGSAHQAAALPAADSTTATCGARP